MNAVVGPTLRWVCSIAVAVAGMAAASQPMASQSDRGATDSANDHVIAVGDMLFEAGEATQFQRHGPLGATFIPLDVARDLWPNGVLPIEFTAGITDSEQAMFWAACAQWSAVAGVRCAPYAGESEFSRVNKQTATNCSAWVGRSSQSRINLASGCWNAATILHEIGHALGLLHEHQRVDRDSFVYVDTTQIPSGQEPSYAAEPMTRMLGPYDFESVMHYSSFAFVPKEPYRSFHGRVGRGSDGRATVPTVLDGLSVRQLYGQLRPGDPPGVAGARMLSFGGAALVLTLAPRNADVLSATTTNERALPQSSISILRSGDNVTVSYRLVGSEGAAIRLALRGNGVDATTDVVVRSVLAPPDPPPPPGAPELRINFQTATAFDLEIRPGYGTYPPADNVRLHVGTASSLSDVAIVSPRGFYFSYRGATRLPLLYVRAHVSNAHGAAWSNEVIIGDTGAPVPPTMQSPVVNGRTVALSWSGGGPQYLLRARLTTGALVAEVPLAVSSVTFAGVPPGTYLVSALSVSNGVRSAESAPTTVTVLSDGPPVAPVLAPARVVGSTVTLDWSGAGTRFQLRARLAPIGGVIVAIDISGNTFTAPGVGTGTYYVTVVDTSGSTESAESNMVRVDVVP